MLGGVVTVQGCNWVLVNNDVAIVGRQLSPRDAVAGLPNGSKRCENSHAAAFYKTKE